MLAGSSHREAAIRVADEIAAMPTATDLAPEIEALVETGGVESVTDRAPCRRRAGHAP